METFAPAYFDYMSSSFTAGVRLLPITLSVPFLLTPLTSAPLFSPKSSDVSKLDGGQLHILDRENPRSTR